MFISKKEYIQKYKDLQAQLKFERQILLELADFKTKDGKFEISGEALQYRDIPLFVTAEMIFCNPSPFTKYINTILNRKRIIEKQSTLKIK